MTTLRTDIGNTRESARRLRVEPIGNITQTNIQKALEQLDSIKVSDAVAVTITSASYVILPTVNEVFINFAGAVTLTLPDAAAWAAAAGIGGFPLTIKDVSGAASSNNITINRAGSDTIDSMTSLTISTDYGGFKLRAPGQWAIVG